MTQEKLQKVLQGSGLDSRRNLREQIHEGRIKVNNKVTKDPNYLVDIENDSIRIDDRPVKIKIEEKAYFILNKPTGVVSTLSDPEGRPTILDLIRKIDERVYPVGRLDYHSEGLILLTNDGDLTNFIISTRNQIPKVYLVKIKGMLTPEEVDKLKNKGLFLEGRRIKPLSIEYVKRTAQENSWIRVTIVEGKKHIIRNLFKYIGHPVEKLKRLSIGTFQLKKLPVGHWRELTREEVSEFKRTHMTPHKDNVPKSTKTTQPYKIPNQSRPSRPERSNKPSGRSKDNATSRPSNKKQPGRGTKPAGRTPGRSPLRKGNNKIARRGR